MALTMHELQSSAGAKHRKKRVGRGNASGKGNYSARGMKGQRARSGGKGGLKKLGMRALLLSIPKKRGFRSIHPRARAIKLGDLEKVINTDAELGRHELVKLGLLKKTDLRVKLLGVGRFTKKITVKDIPVSKKAQEMIEAAGGRVE